MQSNNRERTFLKLLKKTSEFAEQAAQLEQEYDKLYLSEEIDQKFIEVTNNKISIPMLDLSIIKIQQEEEESGDDSQDSSEGQVNEQDQALSEI